MATRSARRREVFHWIPPENSAVFKFIVIRSDGTEDDLTDQLTVLEIEDGVTDTIGKFMFNIWNPNEAYTGVWTGNEIVKYYSDYAATATTLRFRGRIEKPIYHNNQVKCTGRSESLRLQEKTVTKSFSNTEASEILTSLVSSYGEGDFTTTNVNASTVNMTVNWHQKPFWEAVNELTTATGFDIYVDASLDFHFFEVGSVTNRGEAIVHDYNLLDLTEFADDLTFVKNRIIVYGAKQDGIQVLSTAEDIGSQSSYGLREEIVNDDNMVSETQAQEYADYLLAQKKDPPQIGEVTGQLLSTIQPGEKIGLSSPPDNLPPGYYNIISYKHKMGSDSNWITTVNVTKEPRRFSHIMKQMIERDNEKVQASINPQEMRFSYNHLFDVDTGSHTNTEITDGVLKPTGASGTWISPARTLDTPLDQAYMILVGQTLPGAVVSVSGNNGADYQTITDKGLITLSTAKGDNLKIKVVFSDATTQIDSLSILYKVD